MSARIQPWCRSLLLTLVLGHTACIFDFQGYSLARSDTQVKPPKWVAAGAKHSCAITESDEIYCWGSGSDGKLGNGAVESSATPVPLGPLTMEPCGGTATPRQLVVGDNHACVAAGNQVFCWGRNDRGQAVPNASEHLAQPTAVSLHGNVCAFDGAILAAGPEQTCAILSDELWCWGDTSQLSGEGGSGDEAGGGGMGGEGGDMGGDAGGGAPVEVSLPPEATHAERIALGAGHGCVTKEGRVYCWGRNDLGQANPDDTTGSNVSPVRIFFTDQGVVDDLAARGDHTCAIVGSNVACWGSLGDGTDDVVIGSGEAPRDVTGFDAQAMTLAHGTEHVCALAAGMVYCAGSNSRAQLGPENTAESSTFVPVPALEQITRIGAGGHHTCAVGGTGTHSALYCWGSNDQGQLGAEPPRAGEPVVVEIR